jgi:hypothetical protein
MATACRKLYNSEPTITLYDQFEDRKVGLRMITFTTAIQHLEGGGKVSTMGSWMRVHHGVLHFGSYPRRWHRTTIF